MILVAINKFKHMPLDQMPLNYRSHTIRRCDDDSELAIILYYCSVVFGISYNSRFQLSWNAYGNWLEIPEPLTEFYAQCARSMVYGA